MNRDEILNTPVGPELDRLVAEAKGWKHLRLIASKDYAWFIEESPGHYLQEVMRPWSTDIAAAWELVEEMRNYEQYINLDNSPCYFGECEAVLWVNENEYIDAYGQTVPEAIARAYLLAKLEEE